MINLIFNNKIKISLFFLFLGFSVFGFFPQSVLAANYYVSSSGGSDSNDGTSINHPWKTIDKLNSKTFEAGDYVLFKKGDVFYGAITISQSGTVNNPITFSYYGSGNNPVITGFKNITNWIKVESNIWESSEAVSELSNVNVVTVANINTPMGTYPNNSYLNFQSHTAKSITSSSLNSNIDWSGATMVIRSSRWSLEKTTITSQSGQTLNYDSDLNYNPTDGAGFFIQNDLRTLDQQNEWYYDNTTKKIKIYSTSKPVTVNVASIDDLLTIKASNIVIDGLSFTGANNDAIHGVPYDEIRNNIIIKNSNFSFTGNAAIYGLKVNNYLISDNVITDSNNLAIDTGFSTSGLNIKNNKIFNIGLLKGMGNGLHGAIDVGSDSVVENNQVINSGYIGIEFYGDNIVVKNNFVDSFCRVIDDGAGIYTYSGSNRAPMNNIKVTNNIVINGVGATAGTEDLNYVPASGIYLDDNSKNVEVSGNTTYNNPLAGIYLHNVLGNISVYNNNSFDNGVQLRLEYYNAASAANININNNIFTAKTKNQEVIYYILSYNDTSLSTINFDYNYYARPVDDVSTIFAYTKNEGNVHRSLKEWQAFSGEDLNSHTSPILLNLNKVQSLIGNNFFSNGDFNENTDSVDVWNDLNSCDKKWSENILDGGSLELLCNSQTPSENTLVSIPIGSISSNKNYVLKYSFLGSSDLNKTYNVYLRERGGSYRLLTPVSSELISSIRSENEIIFSAPETETDAAIVFEIKKEDSVNNSVWFDNIKFYEANIETTIADDFFLFDYNNTINQKTISLSSPAISINNISYNNGLNLNSYSSVTLIKSLAGHNIYASPIVISPVVTPVNSTNVVSSGSSSSSSSGSSSGGVSTVVTTSSTTTITVAKDINNDTKINTNVAAVDAVAIEKKLVTKIDKVLTNRLLGKLLLQTENKGEVWYVNPVNKLKYYLGTPETAFSVMRFLGTGISNNDLKKIKIANANLSNGLDSDGDGLSDAFEDAIYSNKNNKDSDGDGFDDKSELLNNYNVNGSGKIAISDVLSKKLSGRIVIQVEGHGEAWYINPNNNTRYYLGRPQDAYNIMRTLSLGITNNNLHKIAIGEIK